MLDIKAKSQPTQKQKSWDGQLYISTAEILRDYSLAVQSRQASLIGRREVLSGRAKFGIFGDGKEVAQIAMAKAFRKGDWRSGYYRDQTLMFALGVADIQEFFAQLYADTDIANDPHSGGRQMNSHFATRSLREDGSWKNLTTMFNTTADLSPTGAQMPRLVGLGYASRLYRELEALHHLTQFSKNGDEVAFGTVGNATCAEGVFWEAVNAIGVLHAPVVLSIWDDGYGISVPNEHQLAKDNLTELLEGFRRQPNSTQGLDIYTIPGWNYYNLVETYARAAHNARYEHTPAIIHVTEMTQPQGHSTSGSHERYKTADRLAWETAFDPIQRMREWIIEQRIAKPGELDQIDRNAKTLVENLRMKAWKAYSRPIVHERQEAADLIEQIEKTSPHQERIAEIRRALMAKQAPLRRDMLTAVRDILITVRDEPGTEDGPIRRLVGWKEAQKQAGNQRYGSHLYSQSSESALHVPEVKAVYQADSPLIPGAQLLTACFDAMLARDPRVIAFGEDVGLLGGVNQTWAGLQEKYGSLRVADTGIREATIMGQAIGMALRGLRPIAEIQYLDYLLYAIQILSDDLASLHWRTHGGQKAPVVISTRGHRLEGIWHAGSPMAGAIHLLRGMHILVPRDMTQAAGFYNTLLLGDEPGLVVEVLNGYRLKERLPANIGQLTVPLGIPEVLRQGDAVTVVTYGACCRIVLEAADLLAGVGVETEVIDVQSLLPFDRYGRIVESLKKTSRVLFLDEDMPGGTTAYMMQEVIEKQDGFYWLDTEPRTLSAKPHRPAYGSDGNYFSKPNVEDVFETIYDMMNEADPSTYPMFFK